MNNFNKTLPPLPEDKPEVKEPVRQPKKPVEQPEEAKPHVVKEKVIYREKRGPGCGCRSIMSFGCISIILLIIATVFILVNKPAGIWNGIVTFLNSDVAVPQYNGKTSDSAKAEINSQITSIGDVNIVVTQNQLTALARQQFTNFKNLTIGITPDSITLYWHLDETIPENPLIGIIQMKLDKDNKIYISKIGTNRVAAPDFLNQALTSTAYSLLNFGTNTKDNKYGFLLNLIPANNINIKSVLLEVGQVRIVANVQVDLFK